MTTVRVPWSTVRRLVLEEESEVEPECVVAVRSVIPDGSGQEAEVGLALAAELLDIYRYRYQSIEALRVNRYGWSGFFSALEAATGRVGLLAIRHSGWRFTILLNEKLDAPLACLCRPPLPDEPEANVAGTLPSPVIRSWDIHGMILEDTAGGHAESPGKSGGAQ